MHYRVKRVKIDAGQSPSGYNLLSEQGNLLLAANIGLLTEGDNVLRQVNFTRPDGTLLATMELPGDITPAKRENAPVDFAVVQNYAVYAIFTPRLNEDGSNVLTMEAEGGNWLALPRPDPAGSFALFGQLPEGYHAFTRIAEADLPPEVGRVTPAGEEESHHFIVDLAARRWRQTSLVVLALVFLLDSLRHEN